MGDRFRCAGRIRIQVLFVAFVGSGAAADEMSSSVVWRSTVDVYILEPASRLFSALS